MFLEYAMAPTIASPFFRYTPRPHGGAGDHLVVSCAHNVKGNYELHMPCDPYNAGRSELEKSLLSYRINGSVYDLVTVDELVRVDAADSESLDGYIRNFVGLSAEEVARRITKRWLGKQFGGRRKGIFDQRFNKEDCEGHVVTNTEDLILKVDQYPNLVILKKDETQYTNYRKIKEIDGMFDYLDGRECHVLIMESKCGAIDVQTSALIADLFEPMGQLLPNTQFTYVLLAHERRIFRRKPFRSIKLRPRKIHDALQGIGVNSVFLTFNEPEEEMEKIKRHLTEQYHILQNLSISLTSRVDFSKDHMRLRVNDIIFMDLVREIMPDGRKRYVQVID